MTKGSTVSMNITITEPAGTSGEIIIGIFTACVSIITFIVGAIIESRREKRRFKQEKTMRLLDEKIIAYQNMYAAILEYKSYFELFIDGGNEYKESADASEFAPLASNQKFRNEYNLYSLYLSEELCKICLNTLENGEILNNLAISIHSDANMEDSVEPSCINVLNNIQKCLDQIRVEINV